MTAALPAAAAPFGAFARLLHDHGFAVTPDQTVAFLKSITLLGPRSLRDVYWAARAVLAPPADRTAEFDALFQDFFADGDSLAIATSMPEDQAPARESGAGTLDPVEADKANQSGEAASGAEALSARTLKPLSADQRLARMRRRLAAAAPPRRGFRRTGDRRGDRLDLRRSLSAMVRGEAAAAGPAWTRRTEKLRRVLLLIDISGSMKAHTDDALRFAHALTQGLPDVETFSFGTRLTRLTRSLRRKDAARALAEIAPAVLDWDGGTRIGDNLARFLAIPRFSRASRGALVVVLSDGLERGDPQAMIAAARRLAARSWRLAWLTPLAGDPEFSPDTEALRAILPTIDHLGDGSGVSALCRFVEQSGSLGRVPPAEGRRGATHHGRANHRRSPSHLAAGGPALARRTDAAAHLRPL